MVLGTKKNTSFGYDTDPPTPFDETKSHTREREERKDERGAFQRFLTPF